jgi:hypothetical protein
MPCCALPARADWLLAAALLVPTGAAAQQPSDPLAAVSFLVGDWRAVDTPAGERGAFSFRRDLQNHVLVRVNEAVYAATPSKPASRHDDLMVVYAEDGVLKADYFDSEGHVIRYTARTEPNRVVFVSAPDPRGPRYRLTYARAGDVLNGSFELAAPDAPETFKPYLAWKARPK